MFEYYRIGLYINQVRDLDITNQDLMSFYAGASPTSSEPARKQKTAGQERQHKF